MIKSFKSKALAELWSTSKTTKIDGRLHARILRSLDALNDAVSPDNLNIPGFNFHPLKGFDPTRFTVHINGPWCITFAFHDGDAFDVDLEQYH
jgi:toxin HigB-1